MILFLVLFSELVILYFLSRRLIKETFFLFYRLSKSKTKTAYLTAVLFLPGTFVHEIAHFLAALFLLAPVGQMELMPEVISGEEEREFKVKMGSVPVGRTDFLRKFLIGIAPFILGTGLILYILNLSLINQVIDNRVLAYALSVFVVFEIGNTMFSSKEDLEGAWILLIVVLIVWASLYFLGIRISIAAGSFLLGTILPIVKQADIFLLVPLVVDLVVLLLLTKLKTNIQDKSGNM